MYQQLGLLDALAISEKWGIFALPSQKYWRMFVPCSWCACGLATVGIIGVLYVLTGDLEYA